MQDDFQHDFYGEGFDYRRGSPHLAHHALHDRLVEVLLKGFAELQQNGLPLRVLEVGAGHGGFTEPALAAGGEVTAVDMSEHALDALERRFGTNRMLDTVLSKDGSLSEVGGTFSMLLCVSVLHHMPDYIAFLGDALERLVPGGCVVTLQDPLFYPRLPAATLQAGRLSYVMWRAGQGDLARALGTAGRRLRGTYDESLAADMVEYHVVRQGVDEEAIAELLRERFADVQVVRYWSTQLGAGQTVGERLRLENTFGIVASGLQPLAA